MQPVVVAQSADELWAASFAIAYGSSAGTAFLALRTLGASPKIAPDAETNTRVEGVELAHRLEDRRRRSQ